MDVTTRLSGSYSKRLGPKMSMHHRITRTLSLESLDFSTRLLKDAGINTVQKYLLNLCKQSALYMVVLGLSSVFLSSSAS